MSRRTLSGSRFEVLPIEGEEEGDDAVFEEEDTGRYLQARPGPGTSGLHTQPQLTGRSSLPSSQTRLIQSRHLQSIPETAEEQRKLSIVWDHFRKQSERSEEVGPHALDYAFGQKRKSQASVTSSEPSNFSRNIEEDIRRLKDIGLNVEYPDGKLGEGVYGVVYRGHYGVDVPDIGTNRFAAKVIENSSKDDQESLDLRERFETEKYILTDANHKNVVSIRMIINMGETRSFQFTDDPDQYYLSPDRIYMIMDFADGDMETWLDRNNKIIETSHRICFLRDLFFGMLYLHSKEIIHGDVHIGNALIFSENEGSVAKWSDFGLGFVASNKQYKFKIPQAFNVAKLLRFDIDGMCSVYYDLLSVGRHQGRPETPEEDKIMSEASQFLKYMRDNRNIALTQVHQQFRQLLEDELVF